MKFQRTAFYKGIPGFTVSTDDGLLKKAEASIYRWWWEFMRLSPVFWYARTTGIRPVIPNLAENYEKAGDLQLGNFGMWWDRHGKYLFEERYRPASVRIVDIDNPTGHEFYQKSLLLEIPLTITNKKIIRDIKKILADIEYQTTATTVIGSSEAELKLSTKKYNLTTIENEYWVLIYRILHPTIPLWKIGDRLQLMPNNRVRGLEPADVASQYPRGRGPFARLQSLVGRALYKARFARYHIDLGKFPHYERVTPGTNTMPFGERRHQDFLAATDELTVTDSAWQAFLREEHYQSLLYRILNANRFNQRYIREKAFKSSIPDFIAGKKDLFYDRDV